MALDKLKKGIGKVGGVVAGVGSAAAEKAAKAGGAAAGVIADAGSAVADKAKEGMQIAAEAKLEARKKRLGPVFREDYFADDYDLPYIIVIEDEDQRKGEELCEGAIGWLTVSSDKVEVLHLYREFVDESGLRFHPIPRIGTAYLVDCFDEKRFVATDAFYSEMQKDKMSELQGVAYALGATYCILESLEASFSESRTSLKASVKADAGEEGKGGGEVAGSEVRSQGSSCSMLFEKEYAGSDDPQRPPLRWFKHDREINSLIEMRCGDGANNSVKKTKVVIDSSSSAAMTIKRAAQIDAALKGLKIKGAVSFESQCKSELRQKLVFTVVF